MDAMKYMRGRKRRRGFARELWGGGGGEGAVKITMKMENDFEVGS